MSAWKYKQLMPKLTVDKLKLMDPKQITGLVGTSLFQISSVLQNSPYKTEVTDITTKELTSTSLEDALQKNFIKTCEDLRLLSPKGISYLISGFLLKFEVNCVKTLLRAKYAKLSVEDAMNYIVPVGNLNEQTCRKILENSETIEDVIDFLMSHKNVNNVYRVTNGYDLLVDSYFKTMGHAEEFFENLESDYKVKKLRTNYILDELKREGFMTNILHLEG